MMREDKLVLAGTLFVVLRHLYLDNEGVKDSDTMTFHTCFTTSHEHQQVGMCTCRFLDVAMSGRKESCGKYIIRRHN